MARVTEAQIEAARFATFESAASFNVAVRDFADSASRVYLVPLHQKLQLQALRGIVKKWPVDTGRGRGDVQVTIGTEPTEGTGALDKSGRNSITAGTRAAKTIEPFVVSYTTNTVPYAEVIEAGSSKQAPRGMYSLTINELEAQFR